MRPLVEDAVELKDLAQGAYREVRTVSWREAADEAVSIYVATLRMPTMLFERLAERLKKVEKDLSRQSAAASGNTSSVSADSDAGSELVRAAGNMDRSYIIRVSSTTSGL